MSRHAHERGGALVGVVIAMVMLQLVVLALTRVSQTRSELVTRRVESLRATYAAEAGASMALRELRLATDFDGDGAVGTISDDGDDQNNPQIEGAHVGVSLLVTADATWLVSTGISGQAQRQVRVQVSGI